MLCIVLVAAKGIFNWRNGVSGNGNGEGRSKSEERGTGTGKRES